MNASPLSAPSYVEHVGASQYRYTVATDDKHLVKRFSFKDFVVGQPNELAYAAARRVAESSDVAFNPAVPLRRRWLGQNALDARHRVAHPRNPA